MSDEPDSTWIAAIERALKVARGNGAKAHPRVAAIGGRIVCDYRHAAEPAGARRSIASMRGCDPCSYPECGCAYSQDDPRRADAMSDEPKRELLPGEAEVDAWIDTLEERADAMSDDKALRWCSCKASERDGQHMAWCPAVTDAMSDDRYQRKFGPVDWPPTVLEAVYNNKADAMSDDDTIHTHVREKTINTKEN